MFGTNIGGRLKIQLNKESINKIKIKNNDGSLYNRFLPEPNGFRKKSFVYASTINSVRSKHTLQTAPHFYCFYFCIPA
jgi:hypothetical protein